MAQLEQANGLIIADADALSSDDIKRLEAHNFVVVVKTLGRSVEVVLLPKSPQIPAGLPIRDSVVQGAVDGGA